MICVLAFGVAMAGTTVQAAEESNAWDQVLAAADLTRETCAFDFLDMANWGGDDYQLPYFNAVHHDPLRIPTYAKVFRDRALASKSSCAELVMFAAARMGSETRRTLISDPLADISRRAFSSNSLALSILEVCQAGGKPLGRRQRARLQRAVQAVPPQVAASAAYLLYAEVTAMEWRHRAFAKVPAATLQHLDKVHNSTNDWEREDALDDLRQRADLKYLLVGGEDLALATDRALAVLTSTTETVAFVFDWETPWGRIALHGAQDDVYEGDRPYLLIIDMGGNELYYGGGATWDSEHPVSVLVDLKGDDRYLETPDLATTPVARYPGRRNGSPHPTFGAGVLGYGLLVDVSGNDQYRSVVHAQGYGWFGVGLLMDRAGDDCYECYVCGQGSAEFGVGILADIAGTDAYRCFVHSQGAGATKGCGLLVDGGLGDDVYDANDTQIEFPSPQTPQHNANISQGAGFGCRADYLDGHSRAGGVGGLVDEGGANTFSCGVFGQGVGYWYGLGLLCAGGGNDTYKGVWYAQGAAAHFAVGVIRDEGGDDDYQATMYTSQGACVDYAVGFLIDLQGNDRYEAPNGALGAAHANGFGFFWEKAGDDRYTALSTNVMGFARPDTAATNGLRGRTLTLGLFLDSGGNDTYPTNFPAGRNNALWRMPPPDPATAAVARGLGLDTEAPREAGPR